jgi:hypothetical protein
MLYIHLSTYNIRIYIQTNKQRKASIHVYIHTYVQTNALEEALAVIL